MAIQFRCPGCEQPIEVDDEFAGQTAACPYCRRVVHVPTESTLDQPVGGPARPSDGPPAPETKQPGGFAPPPLPPQGPYEQGLHVGPAEPSRQERAARTYGNYALLCTILMALMFGTMAGYSAVRMAREVMKHPGSQPSSQRIAEIQREIGSSPWIMAANIGMVFFSLAGLALAIVSLTQSRQNNWRAIVSLVFCGLAALCICAGTIMTAMSGLGAAVGG